MNGYAPRDPATLGLVGVVLVATLLAGLALSRLPPRWYARVLAWLVTVAATAGAVLRDGRPTHAVATSKTFRQLARIAGAAPSSEGPYIRRMLRHSDVTGLAADLAGTAVAERVQLPGVSAHRAPQLAAGAIVADAAMDLFELADLEICPWALREGVILRRLDTLDDTMGITLNDNPGARS